jgi:MYXO-CTERM domain-containing protein
MEMNRRLGNLDPRWTPVVGGAALVLLGVVGFAVWRQRGSVKPAIASLR